MNIRIIAMISCLMGLMLGGSHSSAQSASRYEAEACGVRVPVGYESDCGTLFVPEDRSDPASPLIELAVMRVRSSNLSPNPDPVVYLVGGPGGSIVGRAANLFQREFSSIARNRDMIFFDQRGTGLSRPRLYCNEFRQGFPSLAANALPPLEQAALQMSLLQACHDRLSESGIRLAAYHSAASAADLEDLRIALGYTSWNLYGVSYGSRLALTALRDYPAGVRSVILDSVYPPQVNLFSELLDNFERALATLYAGCEADFQCASTYPDLPELLGTLYTQLNAEPVIVTLSSPDLGGLTDLRITGDRLVDWVFNWLYSVDDIARIPRWLTAMRDGDYLEAARAGVATEAGILGIDVGMYYSTQCNEEIAFTDPASFERLRQSYPQWQRYIERSPDLRPTLLEICAGWSSSGLGPDENAPISSDVPALLLSGGYDPVTPPRWAEAAAATLSRSYSYLLPGLAHGVVRSSNCAMQILLDFLDNPDAAPDGRCIAGLGGPPFD